MGILLGVIECRTRPAFSIFPLNNLSVRHSDSTPLDTNANRMRFALTAQRACDFKSSLRHEPNQTAVLNSRILAA